MMARAAAMMPHGGLSAGRNERTLRNNPRPAAPLYLPKGPLNCLEVGPARRGRRGNTVGPRWSLCGGVCREVICCQADKQSR
jgi:hypothetical protein